MNRLLVPTPKPAGSIRVSLAIIRSIQVVAALASALLGSPLLAAPAPIDFDTARGAREVGMGGTFRELGIGANSADGNPAAMALFQAFQLEFAGGYDWKAKGWYAAGWARDWFGRSPRRAANLAASGGVMMIGLGGVLALSGNKQ